MNQIKPNAETFKLRALAHLANRNIPQAMLDIQKALEEKPDSFDIRMAAATIDFYSAIVSAALPDRVVPWPVPMDWSVIRRDDESQKRIKKTAETIKELLSSVDHGSREEERLQAWYLACLASDPEEQEAASDYCKDLLTSNPSNHHAIDWVIARNYDVDLSPSKEALEQVVTRDNPNVLDIRSLVTIYLTENRPKNAIDLLKSTKDLFKTHEQGLLWTYWYSQSLTNAGEPQAALDAIEESEFEQELFESKMVTLQAISRETQDWQQLYQYLDDVYKNTKIPGVLLKLCQLKAQNEEWEYVAGCGEQLLDVLGTAESVNIYATALFNTGQFRKCLEILDDAQGLFPEGFLPSTLRTIRIQCNRKLGNIPAAIADAEEEVKSNPSIDSLFSLAFLLYSKGDIRGVVAQANKLKMHNDLQPNQALQLAFWIKNEDRFLAADLWRLALSQGIEDDLVSLALALGMQLGLGVETRPLISRLPSLSRDAKGGVEVVSMPEFASRMREHNEFRKEFEKAYRRGLGPINLGSYRFGWNLAHLYHVLLTDNENNPNPLDQYSLLIRHGNRGTLPDFPVDAPPFRPHLDFTAILLAEHFDLLEKVENSLAPLRIPASIQPALIRMEDHLSHHQPEYLDVYQQILDLIDQGRLHVVDTSQLSNSQDSALADEIGADRAELLELATSNKGYLADYLPLRKRGPDGFPSDEPPSSLPEDVGKYLLNCRSILDALYTEGVIPKHAYNESSEKLGIEGQKEIGTAKLSQGSHVYCFGNIPETLAYAGILEVTSSQYTIFIEKDEVKRIKATLELNRENSNTREWIANLRVRISQGIDTGIYEIIPETSNRDGNSSIVPDEEYDVQSNITLMQFNAVRGDVIWADDRYFTKHPHREGIPIIGINEILQVLVSSDVMTPDEYYRILYRMRAANLRFIPLSEDEILYHLSNANIGESGEIVETAELSILRRSYSAALLDRKTLEPTRLLPDGTVHRGEMDFLLVNNHIINETIGSIWGNEDTPVEIAQAKCNWIIKALYLDSTSLLEATSMFEEKHDARQMLSLSLAGLIGKAVGLNVNIDGTQPSRRSNYLKWVGEHILRPRFDSDNNIVIAVSEQLKRIISDIASEKLPDKMPKEVLTLYLQSLYPNLPKEIRDEFIKDPEFIGLMGWSTMQVTSAGGFTFLHEDFITAAHQAINGSETGIHAQEVDPDVLFKPSRDTIRAIFNIEDPITGNIHPVTGSELLLLRDSITDRESLLQTNRQWFDLSGSNLRTAITDIVTTEDKNDRIEKLKDHQKCSGSLFYLNLFRQIKERREFRPADLIPPNPTIVIQHLRLSSDIGTGDDFIKAIGISSQLLIDEEGILDVVDRLGGLPMPLPQPIIDNIATQPADEQRKIIKSLLKISGSVMSLFNLIALLFELGNEEAKYRRLALRLSRRLLLPENMINVEVHCAILNWVQNEFEGIKLFDNLSPQIRMTIVWTHAHKLVSIFTANNFPVDWILETFKMPRMKVKTSMLIRNPAYRNEVVHPSNITPILLLFAGLSYAYKAYDASDHDSEIERLVRHHLYPFKENIDTPTPHIAFDPSLATDSLGSFLNIDHDQQLSTFVQPETANQFSSESLKALVESSLDKLESTAEDFNSWIMLYAITKGLPIYAEYHNRLLSIISKVDISSLVINNQKEGLLILQLIALQLGAFGEENAKQIFFDKILDLAKQLEEGSIGNDTDSRSMTVMWLFDSLINILPSETSANESICKWAEYLWQIIDMAPSLVAQMYPALTLLWSGLPIEQSQHLAPLIVKMRACLRILD